MAKKTKSPVKFVDMTRPSKESTEGFNMEKDFANLKKRHDEFYRRYREEVDALIAEANKRPPQPDRDAISNQIYRYARDRKAEEKREREGPPSEDVLRTPILGMGTRFLMRRTEKKEEEERRKRKADQSPEHRKRRPRDKSPEHRRAKKPEMMKGGQYKGKMHSYVGGGIVRDLETLRRK